MPEAEAIEMMKGLPEWITRNDRRPRRNGAPDTGVYNHVRAGKLGTGQGQGGGGREAFVNRLDICHVRYG